MSRLDLNRYRKIYSFLRFKPSLQPQQASSGDSDVIVEAGEITFTNADSGSHSFTKSFSSAPYVTATAFDSSVNEDANVNVFITAVSTSAVTIKTSATFTGKVQFHAILPTS